MYLAARITRSAILSALLASLLRHTQVLVVTALVAMTGLVYYVAYHDIDGRHASEHSLDSLLPTLKMTGPRGENSEQNYELNEWLEPHLQAYTQCTLSSIAVLYQRQNVFMSSFTRRASWCQHGGPWIGQACNTMSKCFLRIYWMPLGQRATRVT